MNGGIHDAINLTERLAEVWQRSESPTRNSTATTGSAGWSPRNIVADAVDPEQEENLENPAEFKERLRAIVASPEQTHDYLLGVSMIKSVRQAAEMG